MQEFSCPRNLDVENFLKQDNKAIRFEETDNARTYLILDEESGDILAYFSMSFKELLLSDKKLSKTTIKQMDGITKNAEKIRAFLIGQIGKNSSVEDNPIELQHILDEIYEVIAAARALIGGRIIMLECDNNLSLISYYEKHGFRLIDTDEPGYRTMYTYVAEA